jgi:hypothetical protein
MAQEKMKLELRWVPGQSYDSAVDAAYKPSLVMPWEFIPTMLLMAGGFWWNGEAAGIASWVLAAISIGLPVWLALRRYRSPKHQEAIAHCGYLKGPECWAERAAWDNMEPALKAANLVRVETIAQGRGPDGRPLDPIKNIVYPKVVLRSPDPVRELSVLFDTTRDSVVTGPKVRQQSEALLSRLGLNTWYVQPSISPDPRFYVVTFGVRKGSIDERYRSR